MSKIAVLLTCYNRKEKTINCIQSILNAKEKYTEPIDLKFYITDDGSTDGTSEALVSTFKDINLCLLKGTGDLYWAGGMRNSWAEATKAQYDGFLLINDDIVVKENLFTEIIFTDNFSQKEYNKSGIYIGSTCEIADESKISYGGRILTNKWKHSMRLVVPNGKTPQKCDLGNANVMFVPGEVYKKLGMFYSGYTHGSADYDYTLSAVKKNIPVLITPTVCANCDDDHHFSLNNFAGKKLAARIKYAYSPVGFAFSNYLLYNKRNFWYRVVFVWIIGWIRILVPSFSVRIKETHE